MPGCPESWTTPASITAAQKKKETQQAKIEATDKLHASSSVQSRARRAAFNVSKSGRANLLGKGELVDDVASGRVDLFTIERDALPEPMQAMAPDERQALITETARRRSELQHQITELAGQRADYLKKKVEEKGGARDPLDEKIYSAVREQAEAKGKGLRYNAEAAAY